MMRTLLGTIVMAGFVVALVSVIPNRGEVFAERNDTLEPASSADDQMMALSTVVDGQYQQVTVIDPKLRVMSVYHIDLQSGQIALRSVRNIHWDLRMLEFNGDDPLPQEIRALVEPR